MWQIPKGVLLRSSVLLAECGLSSDIERERDGPTAKLAMPNPFLLLPLLLLPVYIKGKAISIQASKRKKSSTYFQVGPASPALLRLRSNPTDRWLFYFFVACYSAKEIFSLYRNTLCPIYYKVILKQKIMPFLGSILIIFREKIANSLHSPPSSNKFHFTSFHPLITFPV